ncbi:MAG: PKD domain-containing protein [Bacteroidia bacterium]|nr:PKD domain-containing protein [Bacteroidia bacterium]
MNLRDLYWTLLLWSATIQAQIAPWPLSKWHIYAVQNRQPTGPSLSSPALVFPGDSFVAIVDTAGMGAAGITGWTWQLEPAQTVPGYFTSSTSTADTFFFQAGTTEFFSNPPFLTLRLEVMGSNGQKSESYRILQPRSTWGTLGSPRYWVCPGGMAEISVDITTTDVDSIRVWIEQGGTRYDSILVRKPTLWRFTAPSNPGIYEVKGWVYTRGRRLPLSYGGPMTTLLTVEPAPSIPSCAIQPLGRFCVGHPVELSLDVNSSEFPLPSQIAWDFDNNGTTDATGIIGRYVYSSPGTYTVNVTLFWSPSCQTQLQTTVTVESAPTLNPASLVAPSTYVLGSPIRMGVLGAQGLTIVDFEDDGTWEGSVSGTSPRRTPTYRFTSPPPAGGYRVRIRQELCGTSQENVVTWNPTIVTTLTPNGFISVRNPVFCAGDSVTLSITPTANFSPREPGHQVAWNFGTGWTAPSETAVETTVVWSGVPLNVQAQLYHPSGGTQTLSGVSIRALNTFQPMGRHTRVTRVPQSCTQDWCIPPTMMQNAYCGGTPIRFALIQRPRGTSWQWRLTLPTGPVTFTAESAPEAYDYMLPQTPGVYGIESELITSCGVWKEVWAVRVENQGLGRPGAIQDGPSTCAPGGGGVLSAYKSEATFSVCAGTQVWISYGYILDYGGGGIESVRLVYANGQRPEVVSTSGGSLSFVAPFQPGHHTLYQIWQACNGARDTLTLRLEVKEAAAASFQAPTRACAGQPVLFQRQSPNTWQGHPTALQWEMGDGTVRGDTTQTFSHTYTKPGIYDVTLRSNTPSCGLTTFTRTIVVADRPPTAQILSASLSGGILTFMGQAVGADSVVWSFGDGNTLTGVLSGTHTYAGNGPYTLRLYAYNGCGVSTAEMQVTSLTGELNRRGWRIYPNPAHDEVWIEAPFEGEVRLFSLRGEVSAQWQIKEGLHRMPLGNLPTGLYMVQIRSQRGTETMKLLIE